jgi:arylformamidase|tara:strand:+ start:2592 stop:3212 length:621 start_codon:yes stop_codon:yes gene_type:complete
MKIYDISMEIREDMITYKNKKEKKPKIKITRTLKQGANESKLEIESHTGTHADAYFHMLANGKTIENMPLNKFIGDCVVLDFTKVKDKKISLGNFKNKKIKKDEIILLKTRNKSLKKFDFNFTYVDKSGAKFLANKKIKLVGIDNSGIERAQPNHETHEILFKKNIPIVEGLDLTKIKPGRYFFIGLPLKIKGADGSPIRAVLIKN